MGRKTKEIDESTWSGRVAARLQEFRKAKFDTQQGFVEAVNAAGVEVKLSAVSAWERGDAFYSIGVAPIIAEVLGVSVRSLLPKE